MNDWARLSILVVEDDIDMLNVLCEIIQENGATVFRAANGVEALQVLEAERIDLVLSDVQMPLMGGLELVKKIRIINKDIPICLFVTGHSDLTEESAHAVGAAGLIFKPYSRKDIIGKIRQLLPVVAA